MGQTKPINIIFNFNKNLSNIFLKKQFNLNFFNFFSVLNNIIQIDVLLEPFFTHTHSN